MARAVIRDAFTSEGRRLMLELSKDKRGTRVVKARILSKDFAKPKEVATEHGTSVEPDETLGEVAVKNEFGIEVPERSFIRATTDKKRNEWARVVEDYTEKIMAGKLTVERALGLLGLRMQRDIQAAIRSNIPPPNAPSTVSAKTRAGKVGNKTLIDTGQLLNSVAFELAESAEGEAQK